MITVKIAGQEQTWARARDVESSWVHRQLTPSPDAGAVGCVVVRVHTGDVNLNLATPGCPPGDGVQRPLRPEERRVADLWEARGLHGDRVQRGQVVAFLAQLARVLD